MSNIKYTCSSFQFLIAFYIYYSLLHFLNLYFKFLHIKDKIWKTIYNYGLNHSFFKDVFIFPFF